MSDMTNEPLRALSDAELDAVNGAFVRELYDIFNKFSMTVSLLIEGVAASIETTRPCK